MSRTSLRISVLGTLIFALLTPAFGGTAVWTTWTAEPNSTTVSGTMTFGAQTVNVTYTGETWNSFFYTGEWNYEPYELLPAAFNLHQCNDHQRPSRLEHDLYRRYRRAAHTDLLSPCNESGFCGGQPGPAWGWNDVRV